MSLSVLPLLCPCCCFSTRQLNVASQSRVLGPLRCSLAALLPDDLMHSHGCKHRLRADDAQIYIYLQPVLSSDLQTPSSRCLLHILLLMPPRHPRPNLSKTNAWLPSLGASSPGRSHPPCRKHRPLPECSSQTPGGPLRHLLSLKLESQSEVSPVCFTSCISGEPACFSLPPLLPL